VQNKPPPYSDEIAENCFVAGDVGVISDQVSKNVVCTNVQEPKMAIENSDDIRLIVKVAQLYYEQDMTQAQIARELGIYRTTISRLLKRGREQGIVTIAINYDYNENLWLEQQLKAKFGLKEAVVASCESSQEEEQLSTIGQHGAQLVDRLLEPGDIIGFSWGGRSVRWSKRYRRPASRGR
jgi:DNA-binding transcriptional regulator LsrR (DeoR family)